MNNNNNIFFQKIYESSNKVRLTEMTVRTLLSLFDDITNKFDSGESGINIEHRIMSFIQRYNKGIEFLQKNNNSKNYLNFKDFLFEAYKEAKKENKDLFHFKNLCFYFLLYLVKYKIFKIYNNYKKIPTKNWNKQGKWELISISDRNALNIQLTDWFDDFDKEIKFGTTEKENNIRLENLRKYNLGIIKISSYK